jgi:hypothetical protein
MKCYIHNDTDAVGICKNCCKGICSDCTTEVGLSLACSETCIEKVEELEAIMSRSSKIITNVNTRFLNSTYYFIIACGIGLVINSFLNGLQGLTSFILPIVFIIYGAFKLFLNKKHDVNS